MLELFKLFVVFWPASTVIANERFYQIARN
jgi:hypothetical protein